MHSGSNYALFLDRDWSGRNGMTHYATALQKKIQAHKNKFCDIIKSARRNAKVILVHNGDAIDGDHHNSADVCTTNELEQADIHIEIMEDIKKRIGWQRGDELYYTRGTGLHVKKWEDYIADRTNSVFSGAFGAWERLELKINGRLFIWSHHGAAAGYGASEGNALRNKLKSFQEMRVKYGGEMPSVIFFGHVHQPIYAVHAYHQNLEYKEIRGVITPSWQRKTAFAWQVATLAPSVIGGVYVKVSQDGIIDVPKFIVDDEIW